MADITFNDALYAGGKYRVQATIKDIDGTLTSPSTAKITIKNRSSGSFLQDNATTNIDELSMTFSSTGIARYSFQTLDSYAAGWYDGRIDIDDSGGDAVKTFAFRLVTPEVLHT